MIESALALQPGVTVLPVDAPELRQSPRFVLAGLSVVAGPYGSGLEHEQHVLATIGSGSWNVPEYDELRFSRDDRTLRSVWFRIPEVNVEGPHQLGPERRGTFTLMGEPPSQLSLSEFRSYNPSTDTLAGLTTSAAGGVHCRFRIAPDLDLLFADGAASGWLLHEAAGHLVSDWEVPAATALDPQLPKLLSEYLTLVAKPNIEAMQDENPALHAKLERLSDRVAKLDPAPQRDALGSAVADVLDRFY